MVAFLETQTKFGYKVIEHSTTRISSRITTCVLRSTMMHCYVREPETRARYTHSIQILLASHTFSDLRQGETSLHPFGITAFRGITALKLAVSPWELALPPWDLRYHPGHNRQGNLHDRPKAHSTCLKEDQLEATSTSTTTLLAMAISTVAARHATYGAADGSGCCFL